MIYKIVCNGKNDLKLLYTKDKDEVIIACDGGYDSLNRLGINVDYFFGDMDSINENNVISKEKFIFNPIKDETDLEIAIKFVTDRCCCDDKIIVYNATGGRLDHYQIAIRLLKKYDKYNISIIDSNNIIYVYQKERNIVLKNDYQYISVFNYISNTIISLKGFKYPLDNYLMKENDTMCVSNEILDETGYIKTNNNLLIIQSK